AMGGAPRAGRAAIPLRFQDDLDTSAALGVVAIDDTLADALGYTRRAGFLHIGHKSNAVYRTQELHSPLFDVVLIQIISMDGFVVEVHLVVHQATHDFLLSEFLFEHLIKARKCIPVVKIASIST